MGTVAVTPSCALERRDEAVAAYSDGLGFFLGSGLGQRNCRAPALQLDTTAYEYINHSDLTLAAGIGAGLER